MSAAAGVDSAQLDGKGEYAGHPLMVSATAELMHNQFKGSPIEPTTDIDVIQDAAGNPVVLAIGGDGRLRAMRSVPGTSAGWEVTDLTPTAAKVSHFDVAQDGQGNMSLLFASAVDGTAGVTVYCAALLPADTDWSTVPAALAKVGGIDAGFAPTSVRVGDSDDGSAPDAIVTGMLNGQQYFYRVALAKAAGVQLAFPENVTDPQAILGVATGYAFGQRGTFFLYRIGDTQTLTCVTDADADQGSLTYDYSPANPNLAAALGHLSYNCIATAVGTKSEPFSICSDIYVGTDTGVYVFRNAAADQLQLVATVPDVHQLVIAQDAKTNAVWAQSAGDHVYYTSAQRQGAAWSTPILFATDSARIAPMRNRKRLANEIFMVRADNSLEHRWQDPVSTLWNVRTLSIAGKPFMFDMETFTSHIHLDDDQHQALPGLTVDITASEWTYATINGAIYSLDRDIPAQVATDMQGNITIIQLTSDISAPIFHLASDAFVQTVNIYPNGKVRKGLAAVRSADDLRNARTADNKPLLNSSLSDDVLAGTAHNMAQISDASATMVDGQPQGNGVLSISGAGQRQFGLLSTAHMPQFAVGMELRSGTWQAMAPHLALGKSLGASVEGVLGDVLHFLDMAFNAGLKAIEKGVTVLADGTSFVLQQMEDGLSLVLTLAGKVVKLALTTLAAAFKALNWLLKLVGIDLRKILAWLGHLLGWDDIWDTHKILAKVLNSGIDAAIAHAKTDIESWRGDMRSNLLGMGDKLKNLVLPAQMATLKPQQSGAQASGSATYQHTPQANYTSYHLQHGGMLDGGTAPPLVPAGAVDDFKDFIDKIVVPALGRELDDVVKLAEDVFKLVEDPAQAVSGLVSILADLVNLVVDPVAAIVDGLLVLLSKLLDGIKSGLTGTMDVPFLGALYAFVTELLGDEEDFTVVNAVALLAAIPMVESMKLMGMGTPIKDQGALLGDDQLFTKLVPNAQQPAMHRMLFAADAVHGAPASAITYQQTGRLAGSFLGLLSVVLAFVVANDGNQEPDDRPGGLADWMSKMSVAQKAAVCVSVLRSAFTVPVARNSAGNLPIFKICAFGLSSLIGATIFLFPKPQRAGVQLISNSGCLLLAILEDALGPTPDNMTIAADVLNGAGGIARPSGMLSKNVYLSGGGSILSGVAAVLTFVSALMGETKLENTVQNLGG